MGFIISSKTCPVALMLQGNGMYLTVRDVNTLLAGPLSVSMHIFTFNPCVIIVSLLCKKAVGESFTSLVVIQTVEKPVD